MRGVIEHAAVNFSADATVLVILLYRVRPLQLRYVVRRSDSRRPTDLVPVIGKNPMRVASVSV